MASASRPRALVSCSSDFRLIVKAHEPGHLGTDMAVIRKEGEGMISVRASLSYFMNLNRMISQRRGRAAAIVASISFLAKQLAMVPRAVRYYLRRRTGRSTKSRHPRVYSESLMAALARLPVELKPYSVDGQRFQQHLAIPTYPPHYAGGAVDKGGAREKKILEYFVSLDLLDIQPEDVVIDVGSEWSIFPEVLQELTGATVYCQDLIYPSGIDGNCIGGSAGDMPVPDEFADKLVLHNSFEHFEGTADTEFIFEAWRVLRSGGLLCILPLYLADRYCILSDPLVDRKSVVWDEGAELVELPWWHNRFGRFYDPRALRQRVLEPALHCGFQIALYRIKNVKGILSSSRLHFALSLWKPVNG